MNEAGEYNPCMNLNPYQPPVQQSSEAAVADPLRLPAMGCLVAAGLGIACAGWMVYQSMSLLELAREYDSDKALNAAWELSYSAAWTFALCILAIFVAWSLASRRNKWIVLLSSLVGIALCLPAPLAAIILLRLRRQEVWKSFGRK